MVNDRLIATKKIQDALIAAGYRVKLEAEGKLAVHEKDFVGTFRGNIYIGQWVEFTRLATKRIERIANHAAEGC